MPIDSVGSDPFSIPDQPANILSYDKGLLKSDETQTVCMVLESSISNEGAGEGLYTGFFFFCLLFLFLYFFLFFSLSLSICHFLIGMNFPENHILGKYWGCVALVLDSYMEDFDFWGYKERAILLQTQPFLNTALGPAKLYIVGSKNCSLSYMNTIEDDTQWDISGLQAKFFMKEKKDFLEDPKSCFNVIFQELSSDEYSSTTKTFTSWTAFLRWLLACPVVAVTTLSVAHAEELYACYFKEFPARNKLVARN